MLHLGLISDLPRKSLPAIGHRVGADPQALHNFIANATWSLDNLRQERLELTREALRGRPFVLIIDETGDLKKGKTTDYVAHQYIGNLGTVDRGIVSVSAYGLLDNITFPLSFQIFKPEHCLKPDENLPLQAHDRRPTRASDRCRWLQDQARAADALYGESRPFIATLEELKLPYVVAIRENHGVWMKRGERVRSTRWRPFQRVFSDGSEEKRFVRAIVFGKRHRIRYYELTSDPEKLPAATTRFVMTNLEGELRSQPGQLLRLTNLDRVRLQADQERARLGDYRLTDYHDIERWWELVFSAYLMVSLQTSVLTPVAESEPAQVTPSAAPEPSPVTKHPWWDPELSWKRTLNNLRLLIQPFCTLCLLLP